MPHFVRIRFQFLYQPSLRTQTESNYWFGTSNGTWNKHYFANLAIQSPTSQNWPDELISDYAEQERTTNQSIYENTAAGEAVCSAQLWWKFRCLCKKSSRLAYQRLRQHEKVLNLAFLVGLQPDCCWVVPFWFSISIVIFISRAFCFVEGLLITSDWTS